jgi:hypothetical protein
MGTLESIGRVCCLDKDYKPGPSLWKAQMRVQQLRSGQSLLYTSW